MIHKNASDRDGEDVCVLLIENFSHNDDVWRTVQKTFPDAALWFCTDIKRAPVIRDLRISNIPEIVSDDIIFRPLPDITQKYGFCFFEDTGEDEFDWDTGDAHSAEVVSESDFAYTPRQMETRPLGSFRRFVIVRGSKDDQNPFKKSNHHALSAAVLCHEMRAGHVSRDAEILLVDGFARSSSPAPLDTIHQTGEELLSQGHDARRLLNAWMFRNIWPLLNLDSILHDKKLDLRNTYLNIFHVMTLLHMREGRKPDVEPDVWTYLTSTGLVDNGDLTGAGHRVCKAMHPSAYDPGFFDRYEMWIRNWDEQRPAAERWIRTFAGRLRRHQAKIWALSSQDDPVFRKAIALMQQDVDTRDLSLLAAAIWIGLDTKIPESDVVKIVTHARSVWLAEQVRVHRVDYTFSEKVMAYKSLMGTYNHVIPLLNTSKDREDEVLRIIPSSWAAGAKSAFQSARSGAESLNAITSAKLPESLLNAVCVDAVAAEDIASFMWPRKSHDELEFGTAAWEDDQNKRFVRSCNPKFLFDETLRAYALQHPRSALIIAEAQFRQGAVAAYTMMTQDLSPENLDRLVSEVRTRVAIRFE